MKTSATSVLILCWLLAGGNSAKAGKPGYEWVKDAQVSSQATLSAGQASRMLNLTEAQTLVRVREIMARDLHMTVEPFQNHQQAAKTTPATVLPEPNTQKPTGFASKEYFIALEVNLKQHETHSQVMARAYPVYRIHNQEEEQGTGDRNRVSEIMVKTSGDQVLGMGPVLVMPVAGRPLDYAAQTLPDAGKRCAQLVRAFIAGLDQTQAKP